MPRLILTERKQLGELYHFSKLSAIASIIKQDLLKGSSYVEFEGEGHFISFTRNKHLWPDMAGIQVDGDKLSDKYEIAPIDYFYRSTSMGKGSTFRGRGSHMDEYEERLSLGNRHGVDQIKKYITAIIVPITVGVREEEEKAFLEDWAYSRGIPVIYR